MRLLVIAFWFVGLALLVFTPSRVVAQAPTIMVAKHVWSAPARTWQPAVAASAYQSPAAPSAAKTIAIHGAVGTGAGLIIGLLLSGASVDGDQTSVVLTWTALGAAAGVVSGVVTWLVRR